MRARLPFGGDGVSLLTPPLPRRRAAPGLAAGKGSGSAHPPAPGEAIGGTKWSGPDQGRPGVHPGRGVRGPVSSSRRARGRVPRTGRGSGLDQGELGVVGRPTSVTLWVRRTRIGDDTERVVTRRP